MQDKGRAAALGTNRSRTSDRIGIIVFTTFANKQHVETFDCKLSALHLISTTWVYQRALERSKR